MPLSICTTQPSHLKEQRMVHGKRSIFLDSGLSSIEKKGQPLSRNFCSLLVNLASTGLELNYRGAHSRCEIAKSSLLPAHSLHYLHWKFIAAKEPFGLATLQLVIFAGKEVVAGVVPLLAVSCFAAPLNVFLSGCNSLLQKYLPLFLHYCYRPIC